MFNVPGVLTEISMAQVQPEQNQCQLYSLDIISIV